MHVDAGRQSVRRSCRGYRELTSPARGYPTTREELFGYDVVICSDIARTSFTPEQLDWTVELVAKRGGGFAMIGGNTSFGSGGWDQTVWDGMIPVDMSGHGPAAIRELLGNVACRDSSASRSTIRSGKLSMTPSATARCSPALPMFYGTNLTDRLKPAATALGLSQRPTFRLANCDRFFLPDVRPRPDIRHVERHHRRLGSRLRA